MRVACLVVPFVLSCALVGSWPEATRARPQELMGPDAILSRMRAAYATCRTYRDTGLVRLMQFHEDGYHRAVEWSFSTAFVRPDRFRFEYGQKALPGATRPPFRHIVWQRGTEILTARNPAVDEPGPAPGAPPINVRMALVFANGTSRGSSTSVPLLLMADAPDGPFSRARLPWDRAEQVDIVSLDARRCYRIKGTRGNMPVTVWIDAATFLIRKIHEQQGDVIRGSETTVTYDAAVDTEIPDALLELGAPAPVRR